MSDIKEEAKMQEDVCETCHDHHDEQDHDHCHGHDHGGSRVIMGSSQGHVLGTMTAYTPASLPVAVLNMELSMKDVSVFIKEHGGVPLQIKASLKDTSSTMILNLVGKDIFRSEMEETTETDPTKVKCKLLAVADGIEADMLKQALEEYKGYFVDNSF